MELADSEPHLSSLGMSPRLVQNEETERTHLEAHPLDPTLSHSQTGG